MSLDFHPKRGLIKDVDISTLLKMRDEGMSQKEIADAFGVCQTTISYKLRNYQKRERETQESNATKISIPQNWGPVKIEKPVEVGKKVKALPIKNMVLEGDILDIEADMEQKTFVVFDQRFTFSDLPIVLEDLQRLQETLQQMGGCPDE